MEIPDMEPSEISETPYVFDESVIKIGEIGSTDVFLTEKTGVLFPGPRRFRASEREVLDEKIKQYRKIIRNHPELNFYAFYLELIQFSEHNPVNGDYPNADAGQSLEYFLANKPKDLTFETLPLNSFQDHINYYFRTDHHWNVHGMLAGYERIYNMLEKNYKDMSPMKVPRKMHTFRNIEFVGTWARELGYEAEPEPFEVAVMDLPPYKVFDSSGNEIDYGHKDEYFEGMYGDEFYTDHYIDFYGADDIGYLKIVSQNGSDRNLLIIGDSFANSIEPLIASHYYHTYCIDIRRLPDYYFSISEFLAEHEVDDVLILGGAEVVLFTWRWTINP